MSSTSEAGPPTVAVVVSGWPRLSETFALNELLALREAGMLAAVFATKSGDGALVQPQCRHLDVHVLSEGDAEQQGAEVARHLTGTGVVGVHGYFAHRPAAVAQVAARRLGVPFGFSVHALDARKVPADVLVERARSAATVVACNSDVAEVIDRAGSAARLIPHGVDLARFTVTKPPDGTVVELVAVGRLVEKKGFEVVIAATAASSSTRLTIVGDGPLRADLEAQVAELGLGGRVRLVGRRTHDRLPAVYASADVAVVPSVVDRAGDRDGLPNVVLEAMACGRPVVASDVAAIGSAVTDGVTGLLVEPGDPAALAAAIERLIDDRSLRHALGAEGRRVAEAQFELGGCARRFCDELRRAYA